MAITFDTLEYVNELKAADVPDKQAEAQAKAMRRVLDTALAEQAKVAHEAADRAAAELDTKTERAVLKLEGKIAALDSKLESELSLLHKEIALARRDTIIWLGGVLVVGFGLVLRYLPKLPM